MQDSSNVDLVRGIWSKNMPLFERAIAAFSRWLQVLFFFHQLQRKASAFFIAGAHVMHGETAQQNAYERIQNAQDTMAPYISYNTLARDHTKNYTCSNAGDQTVA